MPERVTHGPSPAALASAWNKGNGLMSAREPASRVRASTWLWKRNPRSFARSSCSRGPRGPISGSRLAARTRLVITRARDSHRHLSGPAGNVVEQRKSGQVQVSHPWRAARLSAWLATLLDLPDDSLESFESALLYEYDGPSDPCDVPAARAEAEQMIGRRADGRPFALGCDTGHHSLYTDVAFCARRAITSRARRTSTT